MKLDSSTLFVNTGRKPLPSMQKKKKNSKNTIALMVCIAIIAVLCLFVGLIMHAWFNYNENVKPSEPVANSATVEPAPPKEPEVAEKPVQKPKPKPEKEEKPEPEEKDIATSGEETIYTKAVSKIFRAVESEYSYGIADLATGSVYIENTEKIYTSTAVNAFLLDYVSNAIYLGTFDYDTPVGDYQGNYLMTRAFTDQSTEAADILVNHFGTARINSYLESKGYTGTQLSDTDGESFTTSEDLIRLMQKMYKNTNFFPYSDMYKKMRNSGAQSSIKANLPQECSAVNIGYEAEGQAFEAGIIYTPNGNFAFVCTSDGADEVKSAISKSVSEICKAVAENNGDE